MAKNQGLIIEQLRETDWLFGADHGIRKNKIDNITKYLPTTESQRFNNFDPWWCVTGATLNHLEIIFGWLLDKNMISEGNVKWLRKHGYFDENNKINFDDWFLARTSNTAPGRGNTFSAVADAARKQGLVPQSGSPFEIKDKTSNEDDYWQDIPKDLYKLGEEFKKRFKLNYEIVYSNNFHNAIKYGSVVVGVSNWYKKGIYYVSNGNITHATLLYSEMPWRVFDTYVPFIKQLSDAYHFLHYGYQWYVAEQENYSLINLLMDTFIRLKNGAIYFLKAGTKKIQKVNSKNAGLAAITYLSRRDGVKNISDDDLKQYEEVNDMF